MEKGMNFYIVNKYDTELYTKLRQDIIKTSYLITHKKKIYLLQPHAILVDK